jgi:patatin-like phospholipase/acyl hydrolase
MKMLSLDGGGAFGKVQAKILVDANCYEKFDAFAGTSIGSAISAAIALGMYSKADPTFFDEWMPKIFHRSWIRGFVPFVSKYPDTGLNEALQNFFGSALMGDVKKPLFITAADIGRRTIKVFDSTSFDDSRLPMWEVVRTATAAETYFNPWKGMADGGVFANNPSMVGVAAATRVLKVPLSDLEVLSIGTGRSTKDGQREPRSLLQWGKWLVNALLNGASDDMHDYFVRSMPLKNYVRIQFLRDEDWSMDSVADMNAAMVKWAPDISLATCVVKGF